MLKKHKNSPNPFEDAVSSFTPAFQKFEKFLLGQVSAFSPEIRDAARNTIAPKGKFIRPILVMSAAGAAADTEAVVRRAAVVELTHLSTLVHDDVIDNASMRRSSPTANSLYGTRTAILLGDIIFAHMMTLAVQDSDARVVAETAKCVQTVCEGEIKQTLSAKKDIVSRNAYYTTVYGKTAALFELSCRLGALAAEIPQWADTAAEVGKQLGIAYQIFDDVCDWFMSENQAGKTLGTDLISGKQTFPLIVMIEKLPARKAKDFIAALPSGNFAEIRGKMVAENVLAECSAEIDRRIDSAEKLLEKFPATGANLSKCCAALREMNAEVVRDANL